MITQAQADTILELEARGYKDAIPFFAQEAFPGRNNTDNGHRRTLRTLATRGLITRNDDGSYCVHDWNALVGSYQEWARANDWRDPGERFTE